MSARAVIALCVLIAVAGFAFAWANGSFDALMRWAAEGQRAFQNAMAGGLRAIRAGEPGAVLTLLGLCFAYGFFHAVGPGHGKVLIGGYGLAQRVPALRLVTLALASSLAQAATAVALVYAGVLLFQWSREQMTGLADDALEPVSYAAIVLIGAWLVWRGLRGLGSHLRNRRANAAQTWGLHSPAAAANQAEGYEAGFVSHAHGPAHAFAHPSGVAQAPGLAQSSGLAQAPVLAPAQTHAAGPSHSHHKAGSGPAAAQACETCGHAHGPSVEQAAEVTSLRDALVLIGGIAIRPCTGALFVLILTWNMGIPWSGVAGAFAMGLGTATVTVTVALGSVLLRRGTFLAFAGASGARVLGPALEIIAGTLVVLIAGQLLMRTL